MPFKLSALYLIIMVLLSSCNKENEQLCLLKDLSISFDATVIDGTQTRVTANNWDSDDKIGVYAIQNESTLPLRTIANNYENFSFSTIGDGRFYHDDKPIYYQEDGIPINFVAYYPYQPNLDSYNYPIDINNQVDFLYSNNLKNTSKNNRDNALFFNRVLSKLSLIVDSEGDFTVEIYGVKTKANFSLSDGNLSIDEESIGKLLLIPKDTDNGGLKQIDCFLLPTSIKRRIVVVFNLNNNITYKWTIPHALDRGKHYSYKLKLNDTSSNIPVMNTYMETFDK